MNTAVRRPSTAFQPSLPAFCPISEAVEAMAAAGVEERGAIFTRRKSIDFILDLVDYTVDPDVAGLRLLEAVRMS